MFVLNITPRLKQQSCPSNYIVIRFFRRERRAGYHLVPFLINRPQVSFFFEFPLTGSHLGGQDRPGGGVEQREFTLHAVSGVCSTKKVR